MSNQTVPVTPTTSLIRNDSKGEAAVVIASWVLAAFAELQVDEVLDDRICFTVPGCFPEPDDRLSALVTEERFRGWAVAGDKDRSTLITGTP